MTCDDLTESDIGSQFRIVKGFNRWDELGEGQVRTLEEADFAFESSWVRLDRAWFHRYTQIERVEA